MDIRNKTVVVTGAATGIGRALALAFAQAGARGVAVADLNEAGAAKVAGEVQQAVPSCQVFAQAVDVADAAAVQALADEATRRFGQVDVFCSNAGIILRKGLDAGADEWQRIWEINVMAHIHAARAVLPQMLERGDGYFVNTVSAAGLLSQIGSAPLRGDQARGDRVCRMAVHHLWRPRHQGQLHLPAGRADQYAVRRER